MRVIAGSARSLKLVTPEGRDTRPTTDRIKETLFNMLQPDLPGSVVFDLFAGSGALGIEALSRGAKHAYFVENNGEAFRCVQENVRFTRMEDKATLLKQDVLSAIGFINEKAVDLIFIDPPYEKGYEEKVLRLLVQSEAVTTDTLIVLEAALATDCNEFLPDGFAVVKEKIYKTNKHFFIKRREGN